MILAFGGIVHWLGDGSDMTSSNEKITHFVTDRKPETIKIVKNREYI